MQGGTLNCQGFPCKQKIVSLTRHRRLAGRDPTARRWSPKAKGFKAAAESGVPWFSFMHLHGEVVFVFLRALCVLCGKSAFAFFSCSFVWFVVNLYSMVTDFQFSIVTLPLQNNPLCLSLL